MNQYHYSAFGLEIHSDLELQELIPSSGQAKKDLEVIVRDRTFTQTKTPDYWFQTSPNMVDIFVKDVCQMSVINGNQIVIHKDPDVQDYQAKSFLSYAFGAVLQQRKIIPLHASGIHYRGRTYLFSGPSGIGKSSLARFFQTKGAKIITDDIAGIDFDPRQRPVLLSSYPELKLWEDTFPYFELERSNKYYLKPKVGKWGIPVSKDFRPGKVQIDQIYFFADSKFSKPRITKLKGLNKLRCFLTNIYRLEYMDHLLDNPEVISRLSQLTKTIPMNLIETRKDLSSYNMFFDFVWNEIDRQSLLFKELRKRSSPAILKEKLFFSIWNQESILVSMKLHPGFGI